MKKIYEVIINKEIEIEQPIIEKNDKGEEVKVLKKIKSAEPHKYFLKRPTRSLSDSSELFRAKQESILLKDGILSANQLNRRLADDGGVLTKTQQEEENRLYKELYDNRQIYTKLTSKPENEKTDGDKIEIKNLLDKMVDIMKEIQKFQDAKNSVFNRTAENIANNYCIFWWYLMLSYEEIAPNQYKPIFGEGSYEDKLKKYDEMEEKEDPFEYQVLKKLYLITNLWYTGKAEKPEDFDVLIRLAEETGISEPEEKTKTDIPAAETKKEVVPA